MQRFVLVIEYIGTNYAGSQIQTVKGQSRFETDKSPQKTIQGELEKILSTLTKQKLKTIFSGRTDTGVHAKEQFVHFDTDYEIDEKKFLNSLNGLLPKDISVKEIFKTDNSFHAQKSAKLRWYRYTIANKPQRSALDEHCLLVRETLDTERMNEALSYLIGEHDFSAFKKVRTQNPAKVCKMYKANCRRQGDYIYIDFIANRFLYNMIRSLVGTLLMIEKKSLEPVKLKEILESKDRAKVGPTISPDGLTLMKVIYKKENMETAYENLFS